VSARVVLGDVVSVLRDYSDNHFDGVLCDPPYGLSFMGKRWDYDVPTTELWAEVLRVCKPGAPLLAAFGSRTYHRGVVRIEDAGWEIRDSIAWMYGSGFPKSLDVSKAIDAKAGAERAVLGAKVYGDGHVQRSSESIGFGGCDPEADKRIVTAPATPLAATWSGYGTALKPAHEPYVLARKPLDGTVAENVARWGVGGLAIDACRVGSESTKRDTGSSAMWGQTGRIVGGSDAGRWPANVILDEEAGAALDGQSGNRPGMSSGGKGSRDASMFGVGGVSKPEHFRGDSGGASRFFYCAKASKRERGDGNHHPTVKPLALCEYLARLIMPPRPGVLLVPFAGSGSEVIGALRAGWPEVVGIEREAEYVEIASRRLEAV